ncbi:hypothetical protein BDF22DRAFT_741083 [Syncephalis plumigaleata]|nr:hypothetical protein BDF22DRAFT_741083 [Syncephalis plumigaleata]
MNTDLPSLASCLLKAYEVELQKIDPNVAVPYWDWSSMQNPEFSPVLSKDYYGSKGTGENKCVEDSPFASHTPYYVDSQIPKCICRHYSEQGEAVGAFTSPEVLADLVASKQSFADFSSTLEGNPHGLVHNNIGYGFSSMGSPNDPLFYAHHGFVDMLWASFQAKEGGKFLHDFGSDYPATHELKPWGWTIEQVLNTEEEPMCYRYLPPHNAYLNAAQHQGSGESTAPNKKRRRSPVPHDSEHKDDGEGKSYDLLATQKPRSLPESWTKMNHLNTTKLEEDKKRNDDTYDKLNNHPGYVSPCSLWHNEEAMHKLVESGKVKEFTATVNGKKVTVPVSKGCNPKDAVARTKKHLLDAGLVVLTGKELVDFLEGVLGKGGVNQLVTHLVSTPILKNLLGPELMKTVGDLLGSGKGPLDLFGEKGLGKDVAAPVSKLTKGLGAL